MVLGAPGETKAYPVVDCSVLEKGVREMLAVQRLRGIPFKVMVFGLPDTASIIATIVAEWRASSDVPIELHLEPQHSQHPK